MAEIAFRCILDSGEFENLIFEQGWLETQEEWNKILNLCPDVEMREIMDKEFRRFFLNFKIKKLILFKSKYTSRSLGINYNEI